MSYGLDGRTPLAHRLKCATLQVFRVNSINQPINYDNYNNDFGNSMEMNSWLVSVVVMVAAVSLLTVILGVVNNDGRVEACQSVCNSDAEWGRIHPDDDNSCICIIREAVVFPN